MSGSHNKHAKYSASKADQWVNCPQSVEYINKLIADGKLPEKQEIKDYTQHGTDAHDYAEAQLLFATGESKIKPDYPKQIVEDKEEYLIDSYVNNILDLKGEHTLLVEAEVPLFYSKEETGTVDACVITNDSIHVRDLKWGYTPVSSKFNKQGMIYTRSLIEDIINDTLQEKYDVEIEITDDTPITIGIIQPRINDSGNLHETTWGELKLDTMEIEVVYRKLMLGRPTEFNPTPKGCKWCRANTTDSNGNYLCRARHIKLMGLLPSDLNIHNNTVSLEQRLAVSDNKKEIETYLKENETSLLSLVETRGVAGYKVGRTPSRRFYRSELDVLAWLASHGLDESDFSTVKLDALTTLEKKLPKELKKDLASSNLLGKTNGNPKLVRDDSPLRPFDEALQSDGLFEGSGEEITIQDEDTLYSN